MSEGRSGLPDLLVNKYLSTVNERERYPICAEELQFSGGSYEQTLYEIDEAPASVRGNIRREDEGEWGNAAAFLDAEFEGNPEAVWDAQGDNYQGYVLLFTEEQKITSDTFEEANFSIEGELWKVEQRPVMLFDTGDQYDVFVEN